MVTRAVTGGRYVVDPRAGPAGARKHTRNYVFRLDYRGSSVTLQVRDGFVTDEFIELVNRSGRTDAEESRWLC